MGTIGKADPTVPASDWPGTADRPLLIFRCDSSPVFAFEAIMAAETPEILRILHASLPGPDRKRTASPYSYRLTYRNPKDSASGCVMTWEVTGGRMAYQIAMERDDTGTLRIHCTCADAIFRAEDEGGFCKHVHGLLRLGGITDSGGAAFPIGA